MARAMVLCAGLGTRLRPLTGELPKPLLPVGDRRLLAHIEQKLRAAGFEELVINTHHLNHEFSRYINRLPSIFHVIHESKIRGTAGGIAGARAQLEPPVLVYNGDILASPPADQLLRAVAGGGFCLAVIHRPRGEGTVGVARDGSVVRLRGERFGAEEHGADYIGVAALGARALSELPAEGCLVGDYALPQLRAKGRIDTVLAEGGFSDLGSIRSYHAANLAWLDDRGLAAWQSGEARVSPGVELRGSIVGAGAVVEGTGSLERCVVWPNARARAPLRSAIVTTAGLVVPV